MSVKRAGGGARGRRSWLPRDRAEPLSANAPVWVPPGFAGEPIAWSELSYIAVDERADGVAGLVVTSWPRLDRQGRVRFGGSAWSVGARLKELEALLRAERHLPARTARSERVSQRPVRIGDVFAARVEFPRGRRAAVPPLSRWLSTPVYDISTDARETAKVALYGALAPKMSEEEVAGIAADALDLSP